MKPNSLAVAVAVAVVSIGAIADSKKPAPTTGPLTVFNGAGRPIGFYLGFSQISLLPPGEPKRVDAVFTFRGDGPALHFESDDCTGQAYLPAEEQALHRTGFLLPDGTLVFPHGATKVILSRSFALTNDKLELTSCVLQDASGIDFEAAPVAQHNVGAGPFTVKPKQ
jgi:hypothetical protein